LKFDLHPMRWCKSNQFFMYLKEIENISFVFSSKTEK